ncbi:dihydropteroate synthase [Aestuariispira insulae]|uniref:Dihydropteroate synthase n=1 Tax=Aestuariispira insulae TaxID=1461337 RepID=A0A3D9HS33_9PROT|nr:dihydropteroate synthase [Aestuariispira insulae]RED52225.1 dihydropteroate synthase [Aestuariispira insulae]
MRLNDHFQWGSRCFVMGILNVTPDSFSGDGLIATSDVVAGALEQAERFLADGADVLDIGGESTRPGAALVAEQEELDRVVPVVEAISRKFPQAVISLDTYKARVAEAGLKAGGHIINDVWGFKADADMGPLAAETGAPVILMHNRSKPGHAEIDRRLGGSYVAPDYKDFLAEVLAETEALAQNALACGVAKDQIMLDPGVGFGKTVEQNMALINHLDAFKKLGYPVLLGASRKSFIGKYLDVPADERLEGTAATTALGVVRGADMIRVHDVRHMARIVRMTDGMIRAHG